MNQEQDNSWVVILLVLGAFIWYQTQNPTPPVPPVPPEPIQVAPIPLQGLRVLIISETDPDKTEQMKPSQKLILTSLDLRDYLNSKCVKESDGTAGFRFLDPDVQYAQELSHWQTAMKRARDGLPWIVVSNGKTGTEQKLPETVEETLALIKKYETP